MIDRANAGAPVATESGGPYRVMVCDDSAVIRGLIARNLESDPDIHVVTTVSNGQMAIDALAAGNRIEVCILDIEMPIMDGLTALPRMIELQPDLQVIVASTLTRRNAEISLRALSAGAADYLTKPSTTHSAGADFRIELGAKVKALGAARRRIAGVARPQAQPASLYGQSAVPSPVAPARPSAPTPVDPASVIARAREGGTRPSAPAPSGRVIPGPGPTTVPVRPVTRTYVPVTAAAPSRTQPLQLKPMPVETPEIIAIGSSTGGPQALFSLLGQLSGQIPQPILITQHMPATFTTILAEHIQRASGFPSVEGSEGLAIEGRHVYVAPGDFHMIADSDNGRRVLRLQKTPAENFCRPSVDPMLRSLARLYGRRVLVVILTGMGHDGQKGSEAVVAAGGSVIAQDEATSVVWGMPGSVAMAGLCSAVLPLGEIASAIRRIATRSAT